MVDGYGCEWKRWRCIHLTNKASKGKRRRIIGLNQELKEPLIKLLGIDSIDICDTARSVIRTPRGKGTTPRVRCEPTNRRVDIIIVGNNQKEAHSIADAVQTVLRTSKMPK